MLYDPKWSYDIQLGPVPLRGFIAWLEMQPADGRYEYCFSDSCAIAQFLRSTGAKDCEVDLGTGRDLAEWQRDLDAIVLETPHTFGAALSRARSLLTQKAACT